MDTNITRKPITKASTIIGAYSVVTGLSEQAVKAGFLSASVEDLKSVTNAAGTLALLMTKVEDQVELGLNQRLQQDIFFKILTGDLGPKVDLSEFVKLVEAAQHEANLTTIAVIAQAQAAAA